MGKLSINTDIISSPNLSARDLENFVEINISCYCKILIEICSGVYSTIDRNAQATELGNIVCIRSVLPSNKQ